MVEKAKDNNQKGHFIVSTVYSEPHTFAEKGNKDLCQFLQMLFDHFEMCANKEYCYLTL